MKESHNDARVIRKLSSSPYLLVVADSILKNLDRVALAELIAAYIYYSSKKGNAGDFLTYLISTRFREFVAIAAGATPALLAGILTDEDFRSVFISSLGSLVRRQTQTSNSK